MEKITDMKYSCGLFFHEHRVDLSPIPPMKDSKDLMHA